MIVFLFTRTQHPPELKFFYAMEEEVLVERSNEYHFALTNHRIKLMSSGRCSLLHQRGIITPASPHTTGAGVEQIGMGTRVKWRREGAAGVCLIQEMNQEKWLKENREYRLKEAACELEETIRILKEENRHIKLANKNM